MNRPETLQTRSQRRVELEYIGLVGVVLQLGERVEFGVGQRRPRNVILAGVLLMEPVAPGGDDVTFAGDRCADRQTAPLGGLERKGRSLLRRFRQRRHDASIVAVAAIAAG